jgi:hypothetical protein
MLRACIHQLSGAATVALLALLVGIPLSHAAEQAGVQTVAEELDQRNKTAPEGQQKGGLSDSAVRVMLTYAFSLVPEEQPGPDGKPVKVDKSDPNLFLIPNDDARRVIRASTRSAYADACGLPDLAQANYQALINSERAKNIWTERQLEMINALYVFSASYFAGNVKIGDSAGGKAADASKQAATEEKATTPNKLKCPPEQKQKVMAAINAFVQSVPQAAPPPKPQPAPAQPAAAHSN